MRRINLLPPDERGRSAERFRGGVLGILLIAGALALVVMVGVYLILFLRLGDLEDEVAKLDNEIAQQNSHLAELSPYRDLKTRLEEKKPVADGIYRSRFPWDQFLQGLAFVIPESTALDTLNATASPVDINAPVEQPLDPPGKVTFTGIALPRFENVADYVVRMNNLRYLANSQLTTADLTAITGQSAVSFEVTSELVTVVGENGTQVKLEGGSQDEVASNQSSVDTKEVASRRASNGMSAASDQYGGPNESGRK